ncbi:MAG TPA: S1-like domain-containing RNA-binding protein [Bacteroidales bacterium]|nr:S1-like domain-containing RNA-binding protein [Bacteroidales bacterium]
MVTIGKINTLEVYKFVDFGAYLDGEQYGPILLPKKYMPEHIEIEDTIDVFVYLDSEDRLIATTESPKAMVGDFALLTVKDVNEYGAFLDWGLIKDLFVPFKEQKLKMDIGKQYWVYVYIDDKTERIVATAKIGRYLSQTEPQLSVGDEVEIRVHSKTDLGYKVIVNNAFWGVVYANEVFEPIEIAELRTGFVNAIREDNKLDIRLQKSGFAKVPDVQKQILQALKQHNGFLPLHDKSTPDDIQDTLNMSKKTFKMAIGMLYKGGYITIEQNGIRIV